MLSLSAQVVDAEPSAIGWIAAAIPALGFLVMSKIVLDPGRPERSGRPSDRAVIEPFAVDPVGSAATTGGRALPDHVGRMGNRWATGWVTARGQVTNRSIFGAIGS